MRNIILAFFSVILFSGCSHHENQITENKPDSTKKSSMLCDDDCMAKSKSGTLVCKLTTPELQKRRETVIASLNKKLIEKKELRSGFAYKFPGNDEMIDELTSFIKSERECCDFFTFNLSVSGDKSEAWLELSGPEGVKEVITTELGFGK